MVIIMVIAVYEILKNETSTVHNSLPLQGYLVLSICTLSQYQ